MNRYFVFDTAAGWCGIAWNEAGITRFQLPAKAPRRRDGWSSAASRPPSRAITADGPRGHRGRRRYFAGEEVDFSGFELDLDGQLPFFKQIYATAAAGRVGAHDDLWRARQGARRRARGRSRRGPGYGEESGGADHSLPSCSGGRQQARRLFRAGRRGFEEAHARIGGGAPGAAAAGSGVVRVLGVGDIPDSSGYI